MENLEVHFEIMNHLANGITVMLDGEGAWYLADEWNRICDTESLKGVDIDTIYAFLADQLESEDADAFIERFVDERSRAALDHTGDPVDLVGEDATVSKAFKHV